MKNNVCQIPISLLYMQREFGRGQWTFIGRGFQKKWYSISEDSTQGEGDRTAENMLVELAESGCPIFRATSPWSRGRLKSKGHGKLSIHYAADLENDWNYFSHNCLCKPAQFFTEQSQKCAKSTKPFATDRDKPLVKGNHVPHSCWAWSRQKCFWIVMIWLTKIFYCNIWERIEGLSQQFCTDAGFLNVVQIGQYFMTKDTADFHNLCSGMSWIHFAKRWKIIWPERLDPREHQNWTRIGSYTLLLTR